MRSDPDDVNGFVPIQSIIPEVMKEISRRWELRQRLEAERGRPLTDEEFLAIVERGALPITKAESFAWIDLKSEENHDR